VSEWSIPRQIRFSKRRKRGKKEKRMRKVVILRVVVSMDRSLKWKVGGRRRRLGRELLVPIVIDHG
jgi:hypothetical protein